MSHAANLPYEYTVVSRTLAGEQHSGDAALVHTNASGILVAVVDGLGHGTEAALAADAAIDVLREFANEPVPSLLQRCHERLHLTRGVALVLAALNARQSSMTWIGIGNVEAVLVAATPQSPHAKLCLTNQSGVVGYRLPAVLTHTVPIASGDLLILATDGIDERFISDKMPCGETDWLARTIFEKHHKDTDDALVLVLRWLGNCVEEFSQE